jgi:hypothetical protein
MLFSGCFYGLEYGGASILWPVCLTMLASMVHLWATTCSVSCPLTNSFSSPDNALETPVTQCREKLQEHANLCSSTRICAALNHYHCSILFLFVHTPPVACIPNVFLLLQLLCKVTRLASNWFLHLIAGARSEFCLVLPCWRVGAPIMLPCLLV